MGPIVCLLRKLIPSFGARSLTMPVMGVPGRPALCVSFFILFILLFFSNAEDSISPKTEEGQREDLCMALIGRIRIARICYGYASAIYAGHSGPTWGISMTTAWCLSGDGEGRLSGIYSMKIGVL